MKYLKRNLAMLLTGMLLLLCGGCSDQSASPDGSDSSAASSSKVKTADKTVDDKTAEQSAKDKLRTVVYYPDENAEKLLPVTITVDAADKYTQAVSRLIDGEPPQGAVRIFPKHTKVKAVRVTGKTATVDFSQELVQQFSGGSAGEVMLVGSLVDTLTEFAEVESVRITVEGKAIDTLSGHLDLSEPIRRNAKLIKK